MGRLSLSKKLSLVGILVIAFSFEAMGMSAEEYKRQLSDCNANGSEWKDLSSDRGGVYVHDGLCQNTGKNEATKECKASIKEIKKAKQKFLSKCKNSGSGKSIESCSEVLDDCEASASVDAILDPQVVLGTVFGVDPSQVPGGSTGNKCSNLTYSDYKSELRELQADKEKAANEIKELKKEAEDKETEIAEKKRTVEKEFLKSQKERMKQEHEEKEEERNIEAQKLESEQKLKEKLREKQSSILSIQLQKSQMISDKANDVQSDQLELLSCQTQADSFVKNGGAPPNSSTGPSSNLTNQAKVTRMSGSLSGAGAAKGNKKKVFNAVMKACVEKIVKDRNKRAEKFGSDMKILDGKLKDLNEDMVETQKSIQLLAQQSIQAAQDRANKKKQDALAFEQERLQAAKELMDLDSEMTKSRMRITESLAAANAAVTQANNDLGKHKKKEPKVGSDGTKSARTEMSEAQEDYTGGSCEVCIGGDEKVQNECYKLKGEGAPKKGTSSGTTGGAK